VVYGPVLADRIWAAASKALAGVQGRTPGKSPSARIDIEGRRLRVYDIGKDRILVADLDHPGNLTTLTQR